MSLHSTVSPLVNQIVSVCPIYFTYFTYNNKQMYNVLNNNTMTLHNVEV